MAFELPTLPFPKDSLGTPYIASPDANGKYTVASGQWFKNASNIWVPVSAADPLPIKVQTELPAGAQIIGQVKLTDGTDALLVNANGSINIVPVNSAGTELFTDANPGSMKLTGSNFEQTIGSAVPGKAVQIGVSDGTNLQNVRQGRDNATSATGYPGVILELIDSSSQLVMAGTADSVTVDGNNGRRTQSVSQLLYNGTGYDRKRGNVQGTLLASAARTASVNSADTTVYNASKLAVFLDVTAVSGTTPTLNVVVKARDPVSGKYFAIGTFTQVTAIGSQALFIGSGADTKFATRTIIAECTIGGTTPSFTFSIGYAATVN